MPIIRSATLRIRDTIMAATALGALLSCPAIAAAQSQTAVYSIAEQPLSAALLAYGEQARVAIAAPSDLTKTMRSSSVSGALTAEEALRRLLAGTGLRYRFVNARTVQVYWPARTSTAETQADGSAQEIVVTAQRREQKSKDVPFALTAYSGEALQERGVQTLRDLSRYTPGLLVEDQSPNNPIFVMRGITSSGGDSFTEPRVSVFQDGVSISKSRGSFVELFDIARTEVAKGPQSTLFGRGALIGGINIIQNRASDRLDYALSGEAGKFDYYMVDAMVNLPIADGIALRIAGRHRENGGYTQNLNPDADGKLNGVRTDAIRGTLSLRPDERFSVDIIANYQRDRTHGTGFKSMYWQQTDPATGALITDTKLNKGAWLSVPDDISRGEGLGVDQDYTGVTSLMRYDLADGWTINSITGWRDVSSVEAYDADGISLPIFSSREDNGGRYFSQELRLGYDEGGFFSGFVGANYYRERARSEVDVRFDERLLLAQVSGMLNGGPLLGLPAYTPAPAALFDNTAFTGALVQGVLAAQSRNNLLLSSQQATALATRLNPAHIETSRNRSDLDSYDLFGDMTLRPADGWEISGGIRYTIDKKKTFWGSSVKGRSILGGIIGAAGQASTGTPVGIATAEQIIAGMTAYGPTLAGPLPYFGINAQPTADNGVMTGQSLDDEGASWRLASRYALSPTTNIYGSYARGRRPAVLSAAAPSAPGGAPIFVIAPSEKVDTLEIGIKGDMPRQRLRFDVSGYYYWYDNFQTRVQSGSSFITTNAGKAEAYGLEMQGSWRIMPILELFATYAYSHARFVNGAYDGNRFARSPDHMASIGASLNFPTGQGTFHVRPNYVYRSKIFFADDNDRSELQPGRIVPDLIQDEYQNGFGLLNLRIGYEAKDSRWGFELFGNNMTGKIYRKGAGSAGESIGMPTNVMGDPRTYGIRLSIRH